MFSTFLTFFILRTAVLFADLYHLVEHWLQLLAEFLDDIRTLCCISILTEIGMGILPIDITKKVPYHKIKLAFHTVK
jgi:hypothetical protein